MNTTSTTGTTTATARPWYKHPVAIGVGAPAGAILVIGGSVAIALELTDDLWSPEYASQSLVAPVSPGDAVSSTSPADDEAATVEPTPASLTLGRDRFGAVCRPVG